MWAQSCLPTEEFHFLKPCWFLVVTDAGTEVMVFGRKTWKLFLFFMKGSGSNPSVRCESHNHRKPHVIYACYMHLLSFFLPPPSCRNGGDGDVETIKRIP